MSSIRLAIGVFTCALLLSACGGSGGGGSVVPSPTPSPILSPSPSPSPDVSPSPSPTPSPSPIVGESVELSGTVTYDFVGHASNGGLNYGDIQQLPLRGATIGLLDATNTALAWTRTDNSGQYTFTVGEDENVKVRVLAELRSTTGAIYDVKVTDNTQGNAIYLMEGSVASSGTTDSTRDLHASSGWTGSGYGQTRVAAPFAILDSVWQVIEDLVEADGALNLPAVEMRWSTENVAVNGINAEGDIGTSHYDDEAVYILGHENNDTDEYDRSVVQHEFGHYLTNRLSRDDSIGGPHSGSDSLDMRVAFSEGFANALTALVSGTGYYEDSGSFQQDGGFRINLESSASSNRGFFSENTVGQTTYDLFDSNDDGADTISLPFSLLYQTLTDTTYKESPALTSIYLFVDVLKSLVDASNDTLIDELLLDNLVSGTGIYGEGESTSSVANALPVYASLTLGNTVEVCHNLQLTPYNALDIRRFVRFTITDSGVYNISATRTSGAGTRDPDIILYEAGETTVFESTTPNSETGSKILFPGDYVLEVYDYVHAGEESVPTSNNDPACFDISVTEG